MSTIIESSVVHRIQDELKTLSPQELRLVEIAVRDLQKDCTASEHSTKSENKGGEPDIDIDDSFPKPEHVLEFMEAWRGCLIDLPDWDKKQLREMRLNEKYGDQS
ncbi:MAG: hypothetical protein LBF88_06045 [Planctomycetaceae bacterium]|jgi:hypothetical protein|nr:hypothetical protein [Planctomycetaceae bacterium]